MVVETKKILDPDIKVFATCVRVPVFIGHAEAVNVEFEQPVTVGEARAPCCARRPGVVVVDHREDGGYITPLECQGEDAVYVSRIRKDPTVRERAGVLVRGRQSAQGRGAERGADRRDAGGAGAAAGAPRSGTTAVA